MDAYERGYRRPFYSHCEEQRDEAIHKMVIMGAIPWIASSGFAFLAMTVVRRKDICVGNIFRLPGLGLDPKRRELG
jgi:hypothetical protein